MNDDDWDKERDWVVNNPLKAHDLILFQEAKIEYLLARLADANADADGLYLAILSGKGGKIGNAVDAHRERINGGG